MDPRQKVWIQRRCFVILNVRPSFVVLDRYGLLTIESLLLDVVISCGIWCEKFPTTNTNSESNFGGDWMEGG